MNELLSNLTIINVNIIYTYIHLSMYHWSLLPAINIKIWNRYDCNCNRNNLVICLSIGIYLSMIHYYVYPLILPVYLSLIITFSIYSSFICLFSWIFDFFKKKKEKKFTYIPIFPNQWMIRIIHWVIHRFSSSLLSFFFFFL